MFLVQSQWYIMTAVIVIIVFLVTRQSNPSEHHRGDHSQCEHCNKLRRQTSSCMFRGQKSKCYSCEKQAFAMSKGNECAVFNEHPLKYYEPTQIYPAMGYAKMGPMS